MPFSSPPNLGADEMTLVQAAVRHCLLPHPDVVRAMPNAIFPTIRNQRDRGRVDLDQRLLFDDNTTPRWALLWSHGFGRVSHPKGWTIAHVWTVPQDREAYTRLANLVLLPECLGSLTDKQGPLGRYLRVHAQTQYDWIPQGCVPEAEPDGYRSIRWNYFEPHADPNGFILARLKQLDNQRVRALRPLMGIG